MPCKCTYICDVTRQPTSIPGLQKPIFDHRNSCQASDNKPSRQVACKTRPLLHPPPTPRRKQWLIPRHLLVSNVFETPLNNILTNMTSVQIIAVLMPHDCHAPCKWRCRDCHSRPTGPRGTRTELSAPLSKRTSSLDAGSRRSTNVQAERNIMSRIEAANVNYFLRSHWRPTTTRVIL